LLLINNFRLKLEPPIAYLFIACVVTFLADNVLRLFYDISKA
jgi:hypothetical protein